MSSQAAMLKPVLWERLFERESAPNLSLQGRVRQMLVSAISAATCRPARRCPPAATWPTTCASRATRWCSLTSSWSARAIWCRASAAASISSAIRSWGICKTPRRAMARPPQQRRPMTRSAPRAGTSGCAFDPRCNAIVKPRDWQKQPYPFVMASSTKTCFPPPNGASAVSRRCRCWTSAAGRRTSSPTTTRADRADPHPGAAAPGRLGRRVRDRHHRGCAARALLADLLVNDDTVVGMEDPGYPDARNIFASHTRHLLPLPVDEHGLITGTQLLGCDYLFVTPGHQCPTSVTLSRERRDSPGPGQPGRQHDHRGRFRERKPLGRRVPALKSRRYREGRVIYVGSLAKSFAPGLRIGSSSPRPSWRSSCARAAPADAAPSVRLHPARLLAVHLAGPPPFAAAAPVAGARNGAERRAGAPPAGLPRRAHHRIPRSAGWRVRPGSTPPSWPRPRWPMAW